MILLSPEIIQGVAVLASDWHILLSQLVKGQRSRLERVCLFVYLKMTSCLWRIRPARLAPCPGSATPRGAAAASEASGEAAATRPVSTTLIQRTTSADGTPSICPTLARVATHLRRARTQRAHRHRSLFILSPDLSRLGFMFYLVPAPRLRPFENHVLNFDPGPPVILRQSEEEEAAAAFVTSESISGFAGTPRRFPGTVLLVEGW